MSTATNELLRGLAARSSEFRDEEAQPRGRGLLARYLELRHGSPDLEDTEARAALAADLDLEEEQLRIGLLAEGKGSQVVGSKGLGGLLAKWVAARRGATFAGAIW